MEYEAKFEAKEVFYSSLAKYNIRTKSIISKNDERLLYGNGGVPMAWHEQNGIVFMDTSDSHTLIIGATGSKKSRLFVMPTVKLLGYAGESMIITDPKAEIYDRTANELSKNGYQIYVINLRNPIESNSWNPLEIPYHFYCTGYKDKAYEFVNDIATNLMLSEINVKDPYWDNCASDVFLGLTLLLFRICKENNLSSDLVNIGNLLLLRRKLFSEHMDYGRFMKQPIGRLIEDDEIIEASLIGAIGNAPNTQKNILGVFDSKMRTFIIQPTLSQMLSKSSIQLSSIGKQKTAIFLIMPDEKTSYHKLISIFIKQSYEYLIYQAQSLTRKTMPIRINYVLDEFSSLPTIQDFPSMISAARSRNIRFDLIIQSKHQLIQRYGNEAETIQSNCVNWVFLTSRELPLLEYVSALCGNRSGGAKPLLTVSELQRFNKEKGEVLILCGRKKPFKGNLPDIGQYDDDIFEKLELPFQDYAFDESIRKEFIAQLNTLFKYNNYTNSWVDSQEWYQGINEYGKIEEDINVNIKNDSKNIVDNILDTSIEGNCVDASKSITLNENDDEVILNEIIIKQLIDFFQSRIQITKTTSKKCEILFPIYKIDGGKYEIYLIIENNKFYLSDEGTTYIELNKIFELREPDVMKNLNAILKQYGCKKVGKNITIECSLYDVHIKMGYLLQALSFMLNMKIFYV